MAANTRDEILGKKVAHFRSRMNWPLKTLAGDLGVSIQQLQRYEKGINKISATMLFELSKIFKVDITAFFDDDDHNFLEADSFNILLVEDNVNDEFLLRKALSDFPKKLNIYTINDGYAAMDFFNDISNGQINDLPKPDLIFLDLHLPLMRGLDILKDMKRKVPLQEIPVIVLSSSINPEDRASAYGLQASGFIRKSFDYEEFKEHILKAMSYWTDAVELPRFSEMHRAS